MASVGLGCADPLAGLLNGISLAQGARWEERRAADAEPEWESVASWQI
jgi:hypothetical protein